MKERRISARGSCPVLTAFLAASACIVLACRYREQVVLHVRLELLAVVGRGTASSVCSDLTGICPAWRSVEVAARDRPNALVRYLCDERMLEVQGFGRVSMKHFVASALVRQRGAHTLAREHLVDLVGRDNGREPIFPDALERWNDFVSHWQCSDPDKL